MLAAQALCPLLGCRARANLGNTADNFGA